ncbi:MAG: glycosyltransferase family 4 protein [Rubricoccaceae bacterium]|nr:glycosyltransferase family 4 protein [Rubricoccaceae bacterium]
MEPLLRRVLVVTYYFPPAGGPAVQRMAKTVKYLRGFGYEPEVLTVANGAYPQHDPSLAADVPAGVAVHRTRSFDPFGVYARVTGKRKADAVPVGSIGGDRWVERLAKWVRANMFLPDARVGWAPFAAREALRLHDERPFDAVLTSGPPHSDHLIGRALKRRAGVPWVADFRDPWTGINYYEELPMTEAARRLDRRLERSVLSEADRVITVSPTWADELAALGQRPRGEVVVVQNGYDEEDFEGIPLGPAAVARDRFVLAYVGSMYATRNPIPVWDALAALVRAGGVERLRLRLVGGVGEEVRHALAKTGLDTIAEVVPYVPHEEAVRAMTTSALLLLVVDPCKNERGILTGKLYEYLASRRPVLALGPVEGDAARLLEETQGGHLFARDDVAGIAAFVKAHYDAWAAGTPRPGAPADATASYSRRTETGEIAAVLDAVIAQGD